MRHVLITGAAGFVGCNLVKRFADAGEHVIALDRAAADPLLRSYLGSSIERVSFVQADIRDPHWYRALAIERVDLVVHAAAVTNVAEGEEVTRAVDAVAVNIGGTANIMVWALAAQPTRVIYISSSAVYGATLDGHETSVDEDQATQPINLYGATKLAAEQIALRLARTSRLPLIAARLAGPFGPMERRSADRTRLSPIQAWCDAAVRGETLAIQRGYLPRDYVYVADTAAAIYRLATESRLNHEVYNVSTGIAVTCEEIIATLRRIVPHLRYRQVDAAAVNLIARPISSRRLQADTGWRPQYDLHRALAEYVAWLSDAQTGALRS